MQGQQARSAKWGEVAENLCLVGCDRVSDCRRGGTEPSIPGPVLG